MPQRRGPRNGIQGLLSILQGPWWKWVCILVWVNYETNYLNKIQSIYHFGLDSHVINDFEHVLIFYAWLSAGSGILPIDSLSAGAMATWGGT